ncbi:hypothetical protein [Bacillus thuringiensis]|uniref:LIM zinc-binding domain-containing protein n=1 Tax=Bacillus thuringiensis TaxID=1428 RepID=A0AAW9JP85_BACTU|nr:hypothetical protein [Bacillus thuringiensis]MDY8161200.1 hypothetical protein [Bacillus thuringiensis]MDZ5480359.1 hypothetical protein [Bacillus thuringiensis]
MRERENWDVLCEVCDKTIERGVATESGENYCDSCYNKLAYKGKLSQFKSCKKVRGTNER